MYVSYKSWYKWINMLQHAHISVEKHNNGHFFLLLCLCPATKDCDSSAAAATQCATSYKEEPIDLSLGDLLAHAPKWICPVRLLFWIWVTCTHRVLEVTALLYDFRTLIIYWSQILNVFSNVRAILWFQVERNIYPYAFSFMRAKQ